MIYQEKDHMSQNPLCKEGKATFIYFQIRNKDNPTVKLIVAEMDWESEN